MKFVIKRNGTTQEFNKDKIVHAIEQAFNDCDNEITPAATRTAEFVAFTIENNQTDTLTVEQIQDQVEEILMTLVRKDVARAYIQWRYKRSIIRAENTTDKTLIDLLSGKSEYWNDENANKNAKVVHTQRDYIAGITSTDITRRLLLPPEVVKAHDEGIIHFHDADYFAQNVLSNCCLINLDDMLQHGTCINDVYIEKPHRLITATTITTQIITAVSSSQYGGCTITLSHLAPFVDISRRNYISRFAKLEYGETYDASSLPSFPDEAFFATQSPTMRRIYDYVNDALNKEITDSMQTFNYQINSMTTTNGQAPFVSVCMYLNEVSDETTKHDLALLIEQMLKHRIIGFKNRKGVYVTPAFPKLLYFLEEDNIHPDSKYYYLTKLAAECTAKRMVPDYISEKVMLSLKNDVYPCMGCVDGDETITYLFRGVLYIESFERLWKRVSAVHKPQFQPNKTDLFIDVDKCDDVEIYDTARGFVHVKKVIRNAQNEWVEVTFSNGRSINCTPDHPFPTARGRVTARDLLTSDSVTSIITQYSEDSTEMSPEYLWVLGFTLASLETFIDKISLTLEESKTMQTEFDKRFKMSFIDCENSRDIEDIPRIVSNTNDKFGNKIRNVLECNPCPHIPNFVFRCNRDGKIAFLTGFLDRFGYMHSSINLYSANREVSYQMFSLIMTIGYHPTIKKSLIHDTKSVFIIDFELHPELMKYSIFPQVISKSIMKLKLKSISSPVLTIPFGPNKLMKSTSARNRRLHESKSLKTLTDEHFPTVVSKYFYSKLKFSYDVETSTDHFDVSTLYSYNCRSFLTPDRTTKNYSKALNYLKGHKYYGRFNQGVVTINLVDVALSANKSMEEFERILDERLELCHKALRIRHDRLCNGVSNMAPIMWQDGALARLEPNESIKELLYHGYSTISLGYAGLYECAKCMTGESLSGGKGKEFALHVMERLNDACKKWKAEEDIDYSVYGTPIESTTYKFASKLKKRFGDDVFIKLDGHDRNYITNSYHIPVFEEIDPFTKLKIESEYQKLSPGGAISYIECADLTKNLDAVMEVMKYIYDNIMYAELNTKSDYCQVCGYDGEIEIVDKDNKLRWRCPNCGNMDQSKMNVARRTCGYIGTRFFNQGRTNEIRDRYVHMDNHEIEL